MIIQIRGTSGSGKTTLVRELTNNLAEYEEVFFLPGRRRVTYYASKDLAVIGSYSNVCGGADTIVGYGNLQNTVLDAYNRCGKVLMEGLMISDDTKQTILMYKLCLVQVLYLTTPTDVCIERVKQRRRDAGRKEEFNEQKLLDRHAQIGRTRPKLEANGIPCRLAPYDQAKRIITSWLKGG